MAENGVLVFPDAAAGRAASCLDLDYRDRRYPEYEPDDEEMYARRGGGRYGYRGRSRM